MKGGRGEGLILRALGMEGKGTSGPLGKNGKKKVVGRKERGTQKGGTRGGNHLKLGNAKPGKKSRRVLQALSREGMRGKEGEGEPLERKGLTAAALRACGERKEAGGDAWKSEEGQWIQSYSGIYKPKTE